MISKLLVSLIVSTALTDVGVTIPNAERHIIVTMPKAIIFFTVLFTSPTDFIVDWLIIVISVPSIFFIGA